MAAEWTSGRNIDQGGQQGERSVFIYSASWEEHSTRSEFPHNTPTQSRRGPNRETIVDALVIVAAFLMFLPARAAFADACTASGWRRCRHRVPAVRPCQ